MGTIRIFFMIAVAITGLAQTPPALAHDGLHDWKLSEILGWYSAYSDRTGQEVELLVEKDAVTRFIRTSFTRIKWRGRFEKLSRNRFILIPNQVTNEKGSDLLAKKRRCDYTQIEMSELHRYRPGERAVITRSYYFSEADARAGENSCGGWSYHPIVRR